LRDTRAQDSGARLARAAGAEGTDLELTEAGQVPRRRKLGSDDCRDSRRAKGPGKRKRKGCAKSRVQEQDVD
jgi:hypothetical protein